MSAPVRETPSAEALDLAHSIVRPEDGGDHRPVRMLSARSTPETVNLALALDAIADARTAELAGALRALVEWDERAGKVDGDDFLNGDPDDGRDGWAEMEALVDKARALLAKLGGGADQA